MLLYYNTIQLHVRNFDLEQRHERGVATKGGNGYGYTRGFSGGYGWIQKVWFYPMDKVCAYPYPPIPNSS